MKPKIIVKAGVPKGYKEPDTKDYWIQYADGSGLFDQRHYERAKAAAIAEAKEFEDEGRVNKLLALKVPPVGFWNGQEPGVELTTIPDGTYDSPVWWREVRQFYDLVNKEWVDWVIPHMTEYSDRKYRTILRLVEKEEKEPLCGDCGQELTLVRPGKHQCDNPACVQNKSATLGAGQEKQSGLTENEILKSPLSESQKKWVLTKPLFMIQGKRDDQLTDYELKEKRAWLEINQAQKSQENQPEEMQEDDLVMDALNHQVTHMNEVYGAAQLEYVNRIKGLLAHIESDKTVIAELSKALETARSFIKEFRDNAAEAGELQFTPKFFQNCDNVIRGYSPIESPPQSQDNQPDETQEDESMNFDNLIELHRSGHGKEFLLGYFTIKRK